MALGPHPWAHRLCVPRFSVTVESRDRRMRPGRRRKVGGQSGGRWRSVSLGTALALAFSSAAVGSTHAASPDLIVRTEAALLDQIRCDAAPQPALAMSAMLRNRLIRRTNYGVDGMEIFVPARPLRLMGFEIVRLAGWQGRGDGEALPPFWRGPGTAPPEHIAITVRASAGEVREELARRGVNSASGPEVSAGDYEHGAHPRLSGVVTLVCGE
jgi:hypothetical protein